ncbi:MAG: phytanoyl-CoA dioxygenase family protein [Proteobacteria bacterium]|nr:phytanoyl-CoA dioxygenase family protein [Pseudomonadota bacterium]
MSSRLKTPTEEQINSYREQGYLILPELFSAAELNELDRRFEALTLSPSPRPDAMKVMNDVMVVKGAVEPQTPMHAINKLMNFEEDPDLYRYALHPGLLAGVRSLIGETIYSISTNVFNKPPGVDGRHPFHQDLRYFRIRPADLIVGTWTAVFPATRESGCLAVIPGSHRGPLYEHKDPDWEFVNKGFFGIDGVDFSGRVHVELQPGDTLLFHPLLIHGSGHNRSTHFRRAISAHYASVQCESEIRDWTQGKQARLIPSSE